MSKILVSISDRWVPDARVDALADFAGRLGRGILAVHVAYGSDGSGADVTPGEKILELIARQLRTRMSNTGISPSATNGAGKVETLFLFSDSVGQAILKTA